MFVQLNEMYEIFEIVIKKANCQIISTKFLSKYKPKHNAIIFRKIKIIKILNNSILCYSEWGLNNIHVVLLKLTTYPN